MTFCSVEEVEAALCKCKEVVYLHRIRLKPFLLDHDNVDYEGAGGHKLYKVDYMAFLSDVEKVFGEEDLEKDPLKEVPSEPAEYLDRLRYRRTQKQLEPRKEARIEELLCRLRVDCNIKGIQARHAFWDAAHAPKLCKIVNHVTTSQFQQGLAKLNLGIAPPDASLLAEKFGHKEHPDLVNYALFSAVVMQPPPARSQSSVQY